MRQNQFQNSIIIEAPMADVYAYLTEYQNMIHLHPLIVAIRELPSNDEQKHILEIKDKIKLFGIIPIYKTYTATVESNPIDQSVTMETITTPNIHIKNILQLQTSGEHTTVIENTIVETPRYLTGFVMKQVRYSHSQMLIELKKAVEAL